MNTADICHCLDRAVYEALLESCDGFRQSALYQNPRSSIQFLSSRGPSFALQMDVFMHATTPNPVGRVIQRVLSALFGSKASGYSCRWIELKRT
jgi:hypothetical protein